MHNPECVLKNDALKLLWDFEYKRITEYRFNDQSEKMDLYLARDFKKLWNIKWRSYQL